MKKKISLGLMLCTLFLLITGCGGNSKDKQLIEDTKSYIEGTVKKVQQFIPKKGQAFEASFATTTGEYKVKLVKEEEDRVFFTTQQGEENGMVTGIDKNDDSKYYVYVGSKKNKKLWSYGTIDLNTSTVTWKDNF